MWLLVLLLLLLLLLLGLLRLLALLLRRRVATRRQRLLLVLMWLLPAWPVVRGVLLSVRIADPGVRHRRPLRTRAITTPRRQLPACTARAATAAAARTAPDRS
jgi:hypothetical protein